jgi:hypothetical protein
MVFNVGDVNCLPLIKCNGVDEGLGLRDMKEGIYDGPYLLHIKDACQQPWAEVSSKVC